MANFVFYHNLKNIRKKQMIKKGEIFLMVFWRVLILYPRTLGKKEHYCNLVILSKTLKMHIPLSLAILGLPWRLSGKESACWAGNVGLIPGLARFPGGGYGKPLHYSCLYNAMDGEAWWAAVHGVAKS